jgi:hypothetical protein
VTRPTYPAPTTSATRNTTAFQTNLEPIQEGYRKKPASNRRADR